MTKHNQIQDPMSNLSSILNINVFKQMDKTVSDYVTQELSRKIVAWDIVDGVVSSMKNRRHETG